MYDFHKGDCGGHLFWKTTANKVLRARYYWLTLFSDVYKIVMSCHECQVFQGKIKLLPLPLKLVEVNAPFQQWGLNFIGEIHPTSSAQHKWILTATDYFTKWIEAIPTRQATDTEAGSEEDDFHRRINQMIDLQQTREELFQNTFKLEEKIKKIYDWKIKADKFQLEDVVLQWDARTEDKGKHGKFENLWKGPYKIVAYRGQNAFLLKEMDG
eukprot:PITA_07067